MKQMHLQTMDQMNYCMADSSSQAYVQKQGIVYANGLFDLSYSDVFTFDLSTQEQSLMTAQLAVGSFGCYAIIDDSMIYTYSQQTFILNISTQSWSTTGNPTMLANRRVHSCMIEPNEGYLYVIGGSLGSVWLNSIEKLYVHDIQNIDQYNFIPLSDTLSNFKGFTRSILYKTDIYVISGVGNDVYYDDIDVIDTTTDSVSLWGKLFEPIAYPSTIIIGTRVYMFGGWTQTVAEIDYWQYFDVFSYLRNFYLYIRTIKCSTNYIHICDFFFICKSA